MCYYQIAVCWWCWSLGIKIIKHELLILLKCLDFCLLCLYNLLKQDHTDSISTTESQHACPIRGIGPMITSMWGTQHAQRQMLITGIYMNLRGIYRGSDLYHVSPKWSLQADQQGLPEKIWRLVESDFVGLLGEGKVGSWEINGKLWETVLFPASAFQCEKMSRNVGSWIR